PIADRPKIRLGDPPARRERPKIAEKPSGNEPVLLAAPGQERKAAFRSRTPVRVPDQLSAAHLPLSLSATAPANPLLWHRSYSESGERCFEAPPLRSRTGYLV